MRGYEIEMSEEWSFEHTVECDVSREFAWRFWTNVDNWKLDSDVVSVELDGPFAVGAKGATQTKSSGRLEWRIAQLEPGRRAVLEFPAPGAVARFAYTFADVKERRTRMTQRVSLSGGKAAMYIDTVGRALEVGIPEGMLKLCEAMEVAERMSEK